MNALYEDLPGQHTISILCHLSSFEQITETKTIIFPKSQFSDRSKLAFGLYRSKKILRTTYQIATTHLLISSRHQHSKLPLANLCVAKIVFNMSFCIQFIKFLKYKVHYNNINLGEIRTLEFFGCFQKFIIVCKKTD